MTIKRPQHVALFALVLAPLAACGGQTLDVGSNPSDGGSGPSDAKATGAEAGTGAAGDSNSASCDDVGPAGPPLPTWPSATDCQEGSSPLQGKWTGYVQGQMAGGYPDNGNFTINLKGDDEALCGDMTFGPAVAQDPAADPEAWYPAGYEFDKHLEIVHGFTYVLASASVSGERVQFAVSLAEPMQSWCELQTPYYSADLQRWDCNRNLAATPAADQERCRQFDPCTEQEHIVSCAQLFTCSSLERPCVCNEAACAANIEARGPRFDLRFNGDEASGELDGALVFLTRQ